MPSLERPEGPSSLVEQSAKFALATARRVWRRVKPLGPLLREPKIVVLRYDGCLAGDRGRRVSMLYVGQKDRAHEFELFLGADATHDIARPEELFRGRITSYLAARQKIDEWASGADLALRELFTIEPEPHEGFIYHPFVDASLRVAAGVPQQIRRVRSRTHRRLLRDLATRSDYTSEIASGPDALAKFFHELHEPYVRARFGKRAIVEDLPSLSGPYDACGRLLLVKHSNEVVAGAILLRDFAGPGILGYHRNGIHRFDSISSTLLTERTAALELFMMRYAIDQGFREIDIGFTKAIASDGRFIHKRRLGCTFAPTAGGPKLVIQCKPAVRPALFSRFALLTGSPGTYALQLGFDNTSAVRPTQVWRGILKSYMPPDTKEICLHAASSARGPARDGYERALRNVAGEREVLIDEV